MLTSWDKISKIWREAQWKILKSSRSLVLRDDCISMQKEVVGLVLSVLPGFFVEHVDRSDEDTDFFPSLPSVAREAQSVIAESEQKLGEAGCLFGGDGESRIA